MRKRLELLLDIALHAEEKLTYKIQFCQGTRDVYNI